MSRAPYGARGLKSVAALYGDEVYIGRAPYGARGLKWRGAYDHYGSAGVAPRMGRVD